MGLAFAGTFSLFGIVQMSKAATLWGIFKFIASASGAAVTGLAVYTDARDDRRARPVFRFFGVISLLATWMGAVHYFAHDYYSKIHAGMGGGKPAPATLVLNKDGVKLWKTNWRSA